MSLTFYSSLFYYIQYYLFDQQKNDYNDNKDKDSDNIAKDDNDSK